MAKLAVFFILIPIFCIVHQYPACAIGNHMPPKDSVQQLFVALGDTFLVAPFAGNSEQSELPIVMNNGIILFAKSQKNSKELRLQTYALSTSKTTDRLAAPVTTNLLQVGGMMSVFPKTYITINDSNQCALLPWHHKRLRSVFCQPTNKGLSTGKNLNNYEFVHNLPQHSVAHVASSANKNIFVFASDMPGGLGGFDLYASFFIDSAYTKPINMGSAVNSSYDEFFPYLVGDGRLFFATNAPSEGNNFDIYTSKINSQQTASIAEPLEEINTDFNEIAFVVDAEMRSGAFATDRTNTDKAGSYNVYNFIKLENNNERLFGTLMKEVNTRDVELSRCVELDVSASLDTAGIALRYIWDMGDGNTKEGLKIKHCYQQIGKYTARLKVVSSQPVLTVENELTVPIEILEKLEVNIQSADTVSIKDKLELTLVKNSPDPTIQFGQTLWKTDDKRILGNKTVFISFATLGWHKVEMVTEMLIDGYIKVMYDSKKIYVRN